MDLSGKSTEVDLLVDSNEVEIVNDRTKDSFDYSKYKNDITGALKKLSYKGYIEFAKEDYRFKLTYNGVHIASSVWESIIIPAIVSIITTLIVLFIDGLSF